MLKEDLDEVIEEFTDLVTNINRPSMSKEDFWKRITPHLYGICERKGYHPHKDKMLEQAYEIEGLKTKINTLLETIKIICKD